MSIGDTLGTLTKAEQLWQDMSPLGRYRVIEKLPYVSGQNARTNAAIRHIADNLEEYSKPKKTDDRVIDDGGIHRIM